MKKKISKNWESEFWEAWDKCFKSGGDSRFIRQGNTIIRFIRKQFIVPTKIEWLSRCDCKKWLRHDGKHENIKCSKCGKWPDVFSPHRKHKKLKR